MRLLIDECVPKRLRSYFPGHDVRTVRQMRWGGKTNGELLSLMVADGFNVFVTVDQNVRHQQNIAAAGVAVLVLVARNNKLASLVPLVADALAAISLISPGEIVEVSSRP